MARQTLAAAGAQRASTPARPIGPLRKATLWAGVFTAVQAAGLRNVLASTALTVAAPVTATAFVYEVSTMRTAQLTREAADRATFASRFEASTNSVDVDKDTAAIPSAARLDMATKLDAMIASRSTILDTFGDEPSTVAPIYARIIKQMLHDDEATFAALAEKRGDDAGEVGDRADRLRDIHVKLTRLAGT